MKLVVNYWCFISSFHSVVCTRQWLEKSPFVILTFAHVICLLKYFMPLFPFPLRCLGSCVETTPLVAPLFPLLFSPASFWISSLPLVSLQLFEPPMWSLWKPPLWSWAQTWGWWRCRWWRRARKPPGRAGPPLLRRTSTRCRWPPPHPGHGSAVLCTTPPPRCTGSPGREFPRPSPVRLPALRRRPLLQVARTRRWESRGCVRPELPQSHWRVGSTSCCLPGGNWWSKGSWSRWRCPFGRRSEIGARWGSERRPSLWRWRWSGAGRSGGTCTHAACAHRQAASCAGTRRTSSAESRAPGRRKTLLYYRKTAERGGMCCSIWVIGATVILRKMTSLDGPLHDYLVTVQLIPHLQFFNFTRWSIDCIRDVWF